MTDEVKTDEVKVGARNSAKDKERLQGIHDFAVENGAQCAAQLDAEKAVITYGTEIKAVEVEGGGVKLGGYLVRYSTPTDPDLTGDFFSRETDFGEAQESDVYFNHRLPVRYGDKAVEYKARLGDKAKLTRDDLGVFAEVVINARNEYEKMIADLGLKGKLSWSSGTADHLVEREAIGNAKAIKRWMLGLDASLTPTPAEPRNLVTPVKSLDGITVKLEEQTMTEELDVKAIAAEAAKAAVDAFVKSAPATPAPVVVEDEADRALKGNPFKTMGEQLQAVYRATVSPMDEDKRLRPLKATGMNEASGVDGGYLLQPQFGAGLWERTYSEGEIMSRVSMDTVGANSNSINYVGFQDQSRVAGSQFGGVTGYWVAEAGTITASQMKLRDTEIKLHKVAAAAYVTDDLLADASAMEGMINRVVPSVLRYKVEEAIVRGTGAGQPFGFENSAAYVQVTRIDANEIDTSDVSKMLSRSWGNRKVWLAHPDTLVQLIQLTISTYPVFLPANGLAGQPYATLFGIPIVFTEHTKGLGTVGDLVLADLSQYQMIVKGGIASAVSPHVRFLNSEQVFKFEYRVGGAPMWDLPLTPDYGSNTLSPFVALSTSS